MIIKHVDVESLQQIPTAAEDMFILNGQDALEMVNKVSHIDDDDDDDDALLSRTIIIITMTLYHAS